MKNEKIDGNPGGATSWFATFTKGSAMSDAGELGQGQGPYYMKLESLIFRLCCLPPALISLLTERLHKLYQPGSCSKPYFIQRWHSCNRQRRHIVHVACPPDGQIYIYIYIYHFAMETAGRYTPCPIGEYHIESLAGILILIGCDYWPSTARPLKKSVLLITQHDTAIFKLA